MGAYSKKRCGEAAATSEWFFSMTEESMMKAKLTGRGLLMAMLLLAGGGAIAADTTQTPIFGSQMMTERERTEYRARMWAAENDEARAAIRNEHHMQMRERAQREGVTLPETPPERGMGMGPARGANPDAAPGRGMGPGAGKGPGAGPGAGTGRGAGQPGRGMGPGQGRGPGQGPGAGRMGQ